MCGPGCAAHPNDALQGGHILPQHRALAPATQQPLGRRQHKAQTSHKQSPSTEALPGPQDWLCTWVCI